MISSVTRGLSCSSPAGKEHIVVIVAGHLIVDADARDDYLAGCAEVVQQARRAPGCLDFAITADLLDPTRINVFERWDSQNSVEAFRGSGPDDEQTATIVSASVAEYDVAGERNLT
jgi:quinol monooxygenase YgiN